MAHDHTHHHSNNQKILWWSFSAIALFMVVEALGGWLTNSMALLSDAGHMLSDALSLGLALLAFRLGAKAANANKTFGYRRFEILAAAFNGLTLILVSGLIVYEAIGRFINPLPIQSTGMLVIAIIGLFVNIVVAVMMFRGGDTHDNLNMRGAFLHVISDLLGSVAAIMAALAVKYYAWAWADPLISVLVALLVLRSGYAVLRDAVHILMEGSPSQLDNEAIQASLTAPASVLGLHDLHLWSITSGQHALACHLVISEDLRISEVQTLLHELEHALHGLGITHVTLQVESPQHGHDAMDGNPHTDHHAKHEHPHPHKH